jgi:hypothetical protein
MRDFKYAAHNFIGSALVIGRTAVVALASHQNLGIRLPGTAIAPPEKTRAEKARARCFAFGESLLRC